MRPSIKPHKRETIPQTTVLNIHVLSKRFSTKSVILVHRVFPSDKALKHVFSLSGFNGILTS